LIAIVASGFKKGEPLRKISSSAIAIKLKLLKRSNEIGGGISSQFHT
jgi:hypothetical protein